MSQTLRTNTVQRNMYVHNVTKPEEIKYTVGKGSEIKTKNDQNYCTSCINCKNPYCMYLDQ